MSYATNPITAICKAMVNQARIEAANERAADRARPVGTTKIDTDFYSPAEAKKPISDYDFHAHGHHYQGSGARWAVVLLRWTGTEWRRVRRLSGPLQFEAALHRATELRAKDAA